MKKLVLAVAVLVIGVVVAVFTHHSSQAKAKQDYASQQYELQKEYVLKKADETLIGGEMTCPGGVAISVRKFVAMKSDGTETWESLVEKANHWKHIRDISVGLLEETSIANGNASYTNIATSGYVAIPIIDTHKTDAHRVWIYPPSDAYEKASK